MGREAPLGMSRLTIIKLLSCTWGRGKVSTGTSRIHKPKKSLNMFVTLRIRTASMDPIDSK